MSDSHAQWEIRQYANIIGEQIVKPLFPWTFEAFEDYRLHAITLSRLDIEVITLLKDKYHRKGKWLPAEFYHAAAICHGWEEHKQNRERDECLSKLQRLGLVEV